MPNTRTDRMGYLILVKVYQMFVVLLFLAFLCELSESSQGNFSRELDFHDNILNSLNVSEFNANTLNILLGKLKLQNCTDGNDCSRRCLKSTYLLERHDVGENKTISPSKLAQLSTSLLFFLLPEKNSGPKKCQNGDKQRSSSLYEMFLQYYQTNGRICARLLDRILRDLKKEFKNSVIKQKCVSATDLFRTLNLFSHEELGKEQFSTISLLILSHILNGSCISEKDEHDLMLPCKSYFSSNLVKHFGGKDGHLPFEGFKKMLDSIGIGDESSHDEENDGQDHEAHNHRRKKRHASETSVAKHNMCFSADDFAEIFSVNKSDGVNIKAIYEISPALIQQLESKSCVVEKTGCQHTTVGQSDKKVWLYGFLSVLIISLLSLAGIAVIPAMKGKTYKKIIIVLVGLAIGTLTGDALFHLIPHAAGLHAHSHGDGHGHGHAHNFENEDEKAMLWKFLVVASGVYGFFLLETLTHLFLSGGHGHSHDMTQFEHTRKHSPFERNNSCRTVERHEMRLASTSRADASADATQVIFNQVTGKQEEKMLERKTHSQDHEDNIPNLLTDSSDGSNKKRIISSVGWMIIIGDTIHNITDGIAIGAAFAQDISGGLSTSIAVFCHELPHELGDFAVLISSGMTAKQAMLANFLSACSSFIGLVIGILISQQTEEGNQWVFAVMGGMFLYIALVDMLPELMHSEELGGAGRVQIFLLQNMGMLLGFILMLLIAYFEEDIVVSR